MNKTKRLKVITAIAGNGEMTFHCSELGATRALTMNGWLRRFAKMNYNIGAEDIEWNFVEQN